MDNVFTVSEQTGKLLAIYRDFNRVASDLYQNFLPEGWEESGPSMAEEAAANRCFEPYADSVADINKKLLKQIGARIEWALSGGDGTETQI